MSARLTIALAVALSLGDLSVVVSKTPTPQKAAPVGNFSSRKAD
jgi:hypothetical protein